MPVCRTATSPKYERPAPVELVGRQASQFQKGGETCLNDYTKGILEGLGFSLALSRKNGMRKMSQKLAAQIAAIVETGARDLEFRMKANA